MRPGEGIEHSWSVNGLTISGLVWGEPEQPPLLMLHGWLDNAASFGLLAPLLDGFYVVALDLTGHGHSDRRSDNSTYQIWDDLPEILGVIDQLGWDRFDLLGHSRGAIISALLASAFPERVKHLVLLDALSPESIPEQGFSTQLRKFLDQKPALLLAENRIFENPEDAVALRAKGDLPEDAARLLVERALRPCVGGSTWTTDRRLYGASAVKLTAGQNRAVLESLTMPTLLLLAREGRMASAIELAGMQGKGTTMQVEYVSGGHHFHMEPPLDSLLSRIDDFLKERVNS